MPLVIAAIGSLLHADPRPCADPGLCIPPPNAGPTEIAPWAARMDLLGQEALRKSRKGDTVTSFGTVIDRSCDWDPVLEENLPARNRRNLENAIGYAVTQSQRCGKMFGFPEVTGTIPILRRARIRCEKVTSEDGSAAAAANSLEKDHGSFKANTGFDKTYEFSVRPDLLAKGSYAENAASLFHEALHSQAVNNRDWHDEWRAHREGNGCKNTVFEDRIYLLEAACFPHSSVGGLFFANNGAALCAEVCVAALTGVDPGIAKEFDRKEDMGPPLAAVPYKKEAAELVCGRIREAAKRWGRLMDERMRVKFKHEAVQREGRDRIDPTLPEYGELETKFERVRELTRGAYSGEKSVKPAKIALEIEKHRARIEAIFSAKCGSTPDWAWQKFCQTGGKPWLAEIDRNLALVRALSAEDLRALEYFQEPAEKK